MSQANYAHPEVLVPTQWVADNLDKSNVRIVEVDWDPTNAYNLGHVKGAALFDWKKDMNHPITRDIVDKAGFEAALGRAGIKSSDTVILYGDFNNWFAAYAFWVFKYYGHPDARIMNGGRKKWIDEKREFTTDVPSSTAATYQAKNPDENIRAYYDYVKRALGDRAKALVDVRSPAEYKGEVLAPPEYPTEHAARGGHIPGAVSQPWGQAVREDGTFKSADELKALYQPKGVTPDKEIIAYCRIGERSSHTWFVLKYLLGYPQVRNYDGSWTEWGNMVRNPVER
jgi:thiosulfate/3-mercaptopyruvate sulfurtransferase